MKETMKMKMKSGLMKGDYKGDMGNSEARREPMNKGGVGYGMKRKQANMGRMMYKKGGSTQPEYKSGEMHQCKPL